MQAEYREAWAGFTTASAATTRRPGQALLDYLQHLRTTPTPAHSADALREFPVAEPERGAGEYVERTEVPPAGGRR